MGVSWITYSLLRRGTPWGGQLRDGRALDRVVGDDGDPLAGTRVPLPFGLGTWGSRKEPDSRRARSSIRLRAAARLALSGPKASSNRPCVSSRACEALGGRCALGGPAQDGVVPVREHHQVHQGPRGVDRRWITTGGGTTSWRR